MRIRKPHFAIDCGAIPRTASLATSPTPMARTLLGALLRWLIAMQILWSLPVSAAEPQGADPLKSRACLDSVERLEASRADKAPAAVTEALRSRAAQVCLGGSTPGRGLGSAATVGAARGHSSPARRLPEPSGRPSPSPTSPPPPVHIDRPSILMNCDAAGCWDSDGRRLPRVGEDVIGPRGRCLPHGASYVCP